MKNHTDLINHLAGLIKAESYLEIGVFNPDHNFNHIVIKKKVGVDPAVNAPHIIRDFSDEYFYLLKEQTKFDIIFIDGLHHADQVKKDFDNALKHLTDKGIIVLHDCNPPTEPTTCVPRGAQREWCGDVYKFACTISEYPNLDFHTVDFDYGCTVVWRSPGRPAGKSVGKITWQKFQANKRKLLALINVDKFLEKFPANEIEV